MYTYTGGTWSKQFSCVITADRLFLKGGRILYFSIQKWSEWPIFTIQYRRSLVVVLVSHILSCWYFSVHRHPYQHHRALPALHCDNSSACSLNLNPKHRKTKWTSFWLAWYSLWQIQQMGSVSKHPLWPGGFSGSCTGATHKHTNEILINFKQDSGFNQG